MKDGISEEAEFFVGLMRRLEAFSGVQVLTYCLMSNHFHLLVRVPGDRPDLSDEELCERVRALSGGQAAGDLRWLLANLRDQDKSGRAAEQIKERYLARMCDVSVFLQELKGRFAQWYNRLHERRGTLWSERFKSVLVENPCIAGCNANALVTMATYIELNPVRAGICEDPKDYRYCGYSEAVSARGEKQERARAGIAWIMAPGVEGQDWRTVARLYRKQIFGTILQEIEHEGRERGKSSAAYARDVLASGGEMTRDQLLRCRVRYFSDGLILGSKGFVESIFHGQRNRFSPKRSTAARSMRGGDWGELRVFRDLRRQPIG
jgi:REP element-mobilizing transposase RayT